MVLNWLVKYLRFVNGGRGIHKTTLEDCVRLVSFSSRTIIS